MPFFEISSKKLSSLRQTNFAKEKSLQDLVEKNIETVFNCRFVASEYYTGAQHAGRIDTLALSEENNPVIIEYKKRESSELVNQSLYYLSWIEDHHGDFEIEVRKALGNDVEIDWSDVRVICIAPNYKKYDLHAVQVMGANIELWTYRLYGDKFIHLEEVLQRAYATNTQLSRDRKDPVNTRLSSDGKDPVMVAAGKKAAHTRATASYTFEEHVEGKSQKIKEIVYAVQEFIMSLDSAMEEAPKKLYVAYKISQNIVCMEVQKRKILLFLKLDPGSISELPSISRDVSNIGHFGTGDLEITLTSQTDLETGKPFIEMAYQRVGG